MESIEEFNQYVIDAHNAHYINSPTGLIDSNPNASPNANIIWHLYSDGHITYQKGAYAYRRRSEFTMHSRIIVSNNLFNFIKNASDDITYAILTEQECIQFRNKMLELTSKK
jgi:hypothetical protein